MADEHTHEPMMIPLDGTYGPGALTELTVYTKIKDSEEMREETFTIPYLFLDLAKISIINSLNLIAGYKILSSGNKVQGLKELGL